MITIKLTKIGGYVMGDGKLPEGLTPDQFFCMFADAIIDAQARGATQLYLTDEEFRQAIELNKEQVRQSLHEAVTLTSESQNIQGLLQDATAQLLN